MLARNFAPPPPIASKRRVGGLYAAIRRIPEATLAAVASAVLASSAFAHGWIDERAATTGQTGSWSGAVAYNPATQTAELEGEVVFTPKAVSAGNFVTLKFATTLAKMPEEKSPGADAQAALRIGSNSVFQVWTKAGWLDAAASGVAPASGAEYGITFVFDYAAGRYSVSVKDAKGVWQLLRSASGISAFPIAAKAEKVKDIKIDGDTQFRSLEGSFMSFGAKHGAWRSRRRTEAPITARGDFVTIRRHHAQKLEVSSLYGGTNHGARRFRHRTEAPRAEIGGFVAVRRHRARKLEVSQANNDINQLNQEKNE